MRHHALRSSLPVCLAGLFALSWSAPAHAYLDPATGSVILQGLLAGIAGLVVVVRLYWGKLKSFFRRRLGLAPDAAPDDPPPAGTSMHREGER